MLFSAAALLGCGGGGGGDDGGSSGGSGGGGGPGPVADVAVEQLTGTWFGTFDDKNTVQSMSMTVDAGNITGVSLEGTATNLRGTITKATEAPRTFRFTLRDQAGATVSQGALLADPSAAYLVFVDQFFDFGVIQKDATSLPTYAKADIERSWSGDTVTTSSGFTTFGQRSSSAACTASSATTSQCDVTLSGGTARAASALTPDDPRGRWIGSYTDTPATGAPQNGTVRAYLSPDKAFAGVWACTDFTTGFPGTCDFSAWRRQ
jgi:hypothetical protein